MIYRVVLAGMAALAATNALARETETQPPEPTILSETYDAWTAQLATPGEGDLQRSRDRRDEGR